MRALWLHGPDDLRLQEVPDPIPGPGEAVLRVEAALTCATDAKMMRRGAHPALPPLPAPFGHEAAGTVEAVGPGVTNLRPGELVTVVNSAPCGDCPDCHADRENLCRRITYLTGAFAERLLVPAPIVAKNAVPVPSGLPVERAAMVEPLACAVHGAARCSAGEGDAVIVLGGGLQGLAFTALLADRGCRVTLCDPHRLRRKRAMRAGAERALPAPRDPAGLEAVLAGTPGRRGADAVVEAVGSPEAWRSAVELARPGGEVLLHGGCPPGSEVSLPTEPLHYGELTVRGSYHHTPGAVRQALRLLAGDRLPVDEILGPPIALEDVAETLRAGGAKRPVITA